MKITYYGHSCFGLQIGDKHLLFDPFISPNEKAKNIVIEDIPADYILISHGHEDHIADAITIAKRTGAKVIASWEISTWLGTKGISHTHPMNTGGSWDFGDFKVKCVVAQHSSSLPDGSYGGNPLGFLIFSKEGNCYYSGDTALTLDMQLIPLWCSDLTFCLFPIGNNFTMDVADATIAADFVKCQEIIGLHYDTFGYIVIDHEAAKSAFSEKDKNLHLLKIGESKTW